MHERFGWLPPEFAIPAEERVRARIAQNPNAPISVLEALAKDENSNIRVAVADNPSVPLSVLAALAKDENDIVRSKVAVSRSASRSVVENLHPERESSSGTASRSSPMMMPHIGEALLLLDPRDPGLLPESSLLWWINTLTDVPVTTEYKTLTKASRSKEWLLRFGVALHPGATDTTLKLLSVDSDADVAGAARMKRAERARTG
jgi:hypothetical protein